MEYKTQFIHREDRRVARQALFGKHGFQAYITLDNATFQAELSDFSSLGFAISLKEKDAEKLSVGGRIQVSVSPLLYQHYLIKGVVIDKQKTKQEKVKISAVIEHEQSSKHANFHPVHLNAEQSLKGQIVHPFVYKQNSYFEVESLSRHGFYATGIQPEFTLFEGMDVEYSLASIAGLQSVVGRVSNVSLTEQNKIRCFIETLDLSFQAEDELSQHCFHFAQKTPRDISRAGLSAQHIQTLVQYRFVETQAEYEAVLKLRRKSYASQGLCAKDDPIAKFALEQDAYGRILIVFHKERVIGSALLVFGEQGLKPFELDQLLPKSQFSKLPKYDELMEITAICIEKYYQDTDVLHGVFEAMYREGLSAGKQYVIVASADENLNRYKKMGFKQEGITLAHPRSEKVTLTVLLLNKETGKTGKGMSPIKWWEVWGPVSLHLYQRRIIDYSLLQKLRVRFNRAVYSINTGIKNLFRK
ncbi:MAG: N-acyl amino acid synthase FeeM domain-containing protein [Oleiphilus sp.]